MYGEAALLTSSFSNPFILSFRSYLLSCVISARLLSRVCTCVFWQHCRRSHYICLPSVCRWSSSVNHIGNFSPFSIKSDCLAENLAARSVPLIPFRFNVWILSRRVKKKREIDWSQACTFRATAGGIMDLLTRMMWSTCRVRNKAAEGPAKAKSDAGFHPVLRLLLTAVQKKYNRNDHPFV